MRAGRPDEAAASDGKLEITMCVVGPSRSASPGCCSVPLSKRLTRDAGTARLRSTCGVMSSTTSVLA